MASISILVLMTARASTVVRASTASLKCSREHLVVAAEVAGIVEIGGDAHDVGERRAFFGEDAADRLDGAARLLLDRAGDHVAVGVLGDLAGDEDEIAGAHRRMERQVRDSSCRSDRRPCGALLGVVHGADPQPNAARLDDVDAADAVDQIDQPAIVDGDVVGRGAVRAVRRVGQDNGRPPAARTGRRCRPGAAPARTRRTGSPCRVKRSDG